MNNFEEKFFKKYIPEGQRIKALIHGHWVNIIGKLFFWVIGWVLLPSFVYYYSVAIRELIPFYYLEGFLIIMFIKIIYDIFDWYNDVWIITGDGVMVLDWKLLKTNISTINFENIEGIEVDQNGILDKMLKKGSLIIHKIGNETFKMDECINPYLAVELIEAISLDKEEKQEDTKFNMVMETLSGVVEDYLERKGMREIPGNNKYESIKLKEAIEDAKNKDGTIDIR